MKCPYCGYDKIQPNFNFCPKCKKSLKEQSEKKQIIENDGHHFQEKGVINRVLSRWTYERAAADPYAYANWAHRNPNDNRVFLNTWNREGHDLETIRQAILTVGRARQENPATDSAESATNNPNAQGSTIVSNNPFVETVNSNYTTDAAAVVRNKAIWKLQPGELARHIAPDEWVYISEHLEGLVIEEGTSAIIYIDGNEVAQMSSGMYVFDDKRAAAAELEAERRKHEHQGLLSRLADGIYRFFTGRKREESSRQRAERRNRIQQIVGRLKKDTMIDVYLKSDRVFPAIFGQQYLSDSPEGYQPYIIQSRHLDLQVGVSMQMQIGDFKEFIANYLSGRKSVTITDVVKSVDSSVYSILKFRLRDLEISERGLDEATFNTIKNHLKLNLANLLHGVLIVDVLDITTSNEQLARFRQVEEQLYCSEREYDFLQRTNEFRNRIATEENDQKIREANSEQELRVRLDEINKDNLLHTDEMEQFVSLLMNQKAIREASNSVDLDKAMFEIERNRLIAKEEFDIFSNDLENRSFDREQVSDQLRARSLMATALQKIELEKTFAIAEIKAKDEISDAEWEAIRKQKMHGAEAWDLEAIIYGRKYVLERQQLVDDIEKRRLQNEADAETLKGQRQQSIFRREETLSDHEVTQKIKKDEYENQLREQEDAFSRLQKIKELEQNTADRETRRKLEEERAMLEMELAKAEMELNKSKEEHSYELEKEKIKAETEKTKIEAESKMSADQLLGKNIASMDTAAQKAFAESFSNLKEIELTKMNAEQQAQLYQQMIVMANNNGINIQNLASDNAKQQMEMMREMMQAFKDMNISATGGQQNVVNSMLGAMQNFANTRFNDAKEMKEEYRTQMQHEQERVDENQHQALNYTTRAKVSENTPNMAGAPHVNIHIETCTCPVCGQQIDDKDISCCPICGKDLK